MKNSFNILKAVLTALYLLISTINVSAQDPTQVNPPQCVPGETLNSIEQFSYDREGNIIARTISYTDGLGRQRQVQSRDMSENSTVIQQTVYDDFGRPALETLPAVLQDTLFKYRSNFIINHNKNPYSRTDLNATASKVDATSILGSYWQNEALVAQTQYPFTRYHYDATPASNLKTISRAGEVFQATDKGRSYQFSMPSGNELRYLYGVNSSWRVTQDTLDPLLFHPIAGSVNAIKSITIDAEDNVSVSYSTVQGLILASAYSGLANDSTNLKITQSLSTNQSLDLHIPSRFKDSLTLGNPIIPFLAPNGSLTSLPANPNQVTWYITDLKADTMLLAGQDYTIQSGGRVVFSGSYQSEKHLILRVRYETDNTLDTYLNNLYQSHPQAPKIKSTITSRLDYSAWTLNYYDLAGRLRREVQPVGINLADPLAHSMATLYDYNHLGQLSTVLSPDEGRMEYLYDNEGKLRFTQDSQQRKTGRFTYHLYDSYGRITETGEYDSQGGVRFQNHRAQPPLPNGTISTLTLTEQPDGLDEQYCSEQYFTLYDQLPLTEDIPAAYHAKDHFQATHSGAMVVKAWNSEQAAWFGYDQHGQVQHSVHQITDTEYTTLYPDINDQVKTIEYEYEALTGNLLATHYQNHAPSSAPNPDQFSHFYEYDKDRRLKRVSFQSAGDSLQEVQEILYYAHGSVRRIELGDSLQGIDFIYTLEGDLKAINHPSLDSLDPNRDGIGNHFFPDLFGMALDYYEGDYINPSNAIAYHGKGSGAYNGLINTIRFKTRDRTGINRYQDPNVQLLSDPLGQLKWEYEYGDFNQLTGAQFGTFNPTQGSSLLPDYKVHNITYDPNGNLTTLSRNAYDGSIGLQMDQLTYAYDSTHLNQLHHVQDAIASSYQSDFNNTLGSLYGYNENGQLTHSQPDGIDSIGYNYIGDKTFVQYQDGSTTEIGFDGLGNRCKEKHTQPNAPGDTRWLISDAYGNRIAVYEKDQSQSTINVSQVPVYGLGRIGVFDHTMQYLEYELTDHLGNVRATFMLDSTLVVTSWADYYPFGSKMAGRSFNKYPYGYQGQEQDEANDWVEFPLRAYDTKLGKFTSTDPYRQFVSPYTGMGNNPISGIDPTGGYVVNGITEELGVSLANRWIDSQYGNAYDQWRADRYRGGFGGEGYGAGASLGVSSVWDQFDPFSWVAGLLEGYIAGQTVGMDDLVAFRFAGVLSGFAGGGFYEVNAWMQEVNSRDRRLLEIELVAFNLDGSVAGNALFDPNDYRDGIMTKWLYDNSLKGLKAMKPLGTAPVLEGLEATFGGRTLKLKGVWYAVNRDGVITGIKPKQGLGIMEYISGPGGGLKAAKAVSSSPKIAKGAFSIFNWKGYPVGAVKPTGPFRLLEGAEYTKARNLANNTNAAIHRANPQLKGLHIHEIHPVKFGGSPTDLSNKLILSPSQHAEYTRFWNTLMHSVK